MSALRPLISRDKSDTLLLLCACISVLLPHALHVGWWVSLSCSALLAWRAWLTLNGKRLPSVRWLLPVSALMMLGVYLNFHTFFGREAGVTMLVLLLTCKLLEMHAKRDVFVVIFLGFFLLLTSFFYQQGIAAALYSLSSIILLLTAQLSFQYTDLVPPFWQRLKFGLGIIGLAIPLSLCAFVLFPRIQGPLWGLPSDAHSGRSGLSDTMAPGGISELVQSEELAFRVKFAQQIPAKNLLYWRALVMTQFDGKTWSQGSAAGSDHKTGDQFTGQATDQLIIAEPQARTWLFGLDLPASAQTEQAIPLSITARSEIRSNEALYQRIRYQVRSYPGYHFPAQPAEQELREALELPVGINPRSVAFAAQLRQRYPDDEQLIAAILNFFRQQNFIYTLEPELLGKDSIDDFLFESRAGFCEHYASAFSFLLRSVGIPARIVTGYQGGSLNDIDGYLEVRQSDAHAWTEVWLNQRGWVRVDPTAAVAPERIMQSLQRALPQRGFSGLMNLAMGKNSWLQSLRMRWDAVNNSWNLWVLNYNQQAQKNLLASFGLKQADWSQISLIFLLVISLAMGITALPLIRNRPTISALDKVYFSFCSKLEKRGFAREKHEGPIAYLSRLKTLMPAHQVTDIEQFLLLYAAAKYSRHDMNPAWLIKRLRSLAARCR